MSALRSICKDYFRHCRFIFSVYGLPMSFADSLTDYTAAQIQEWLGCKRGTAYDWKDGRREPPDWQQPHWLRILAAASKKHNKASLPMTPARESGTMRSWLAR
jgi:hypothetical protein